MLSQAGSWMEAQVEMLVALHKTASTSGAILHAAGTTTLSTDRENVLQ